MKRVFIPVAEAASLAEGQGRTVMAGNHALALFRCEGEFLAVDDECTHKGAPLGAGLARDGRVACPLHGWEFDLRTGACLSCPGRPLRTYATRVVGGQVEVAVETSEG